jgi:hypothetical protein
MLERLPPPEFAARFSELKASVFRKDMFDEQQNIVSPFVHAEWKVALLPYEICYIDDEHLRRVKSAAQPPADSVVIVSGFEAARFPSLLVSWEVEEWLAASGEMICVGDDVHILDYSGHWGLYSTHEDYSVLGGCDAFMDRFVEEAGGWDALREEFTTHFRDRVQIDLTASKPGEQLLQLASWNR